MKPDSGVLREIYRKASLIKQVDDKIISLMKSGKLAITYYSPRGQEILAAAMGVHLRNEDYVVTTYRGIHDQLAKGLPLKELWAEYAGKVGGTCKGKGGPMHITHPATGVMVTTGIVAGGLPIANGLALASKLRKDGRVTVCNFGDGASNNGAFHEALNFASLYRLPVVFLCQNNRYAEHSALVVGTAIDSIAKRAAAYSMKGVSVDGNDPVAMCQAAGEAVAHARTGEGPVLLEAHTFRFRGHIFGDDGGYIPKEEMQAAMAADPVPALRKALLNQGVSTEEGLRSVEEAIDREIQEAMAFAAASSSPTLDELYSDVFGPEVTA